jgi:hypothetical protein
MHEYIHYIRQIPQGQAGKLHLGEHENPVTIRRRLVQAAQAINIKLIIKHSGQDMYFWRGNGADEQPRSSRRGRLPRLQEETATPEEYFRETGKLKPREIPQSAE